MAFEIIFISLFKDFFEQLDELLEIYSAVAIMFQIADNALDIHAVSCKSKAYKQFLDLCSTKHTVTAAVELIEEFFEFYERLVVIMCESHFSSLLAPVFFKAAALEQI